MKRILSAGLALSLVFGSISCAGFTGDGGISGAKMVYGREDGASCMGLKKGGTGLSAPQVTYSYRKTVYFGHYWQEDTNGDGFASKRDEKQPICWQILSEEDTDGDGTADELFVMADKALDCRQFGSSGSADWKNSEVREWLNSTFLSDAFTEEEQTGIKVTDVMTDSITEDKVYLLSYEEALESSYGFDINADHGSESRLAEVTAFAQGLGAYTNEEDTGWLWLRTMDIASGRIDCISDDGTVSRSMMAGSTEKGCVRPVLKLSVNDLAEDLYSYGETVKTGIKEAQWDTVIFGKYLQNDTNGDGVINEVDQKEGIRWRVLDIKDNDAFLMSELCLDRRAYHDKSEAVTWENSSLRAYLNGSFMEGAFSAEEKTAIKSTQVTNISVNQNGISDGNDTQDYVYLPRREELTEEDYGFSKYALLRKRSRQAGVTRYAAQNVDREYHEADCWWLRDSGEWSNRAMCCMNDAGTVSYYGFSVDTQHVYLRPVLHLDLSEAVWEKGEPVLADETASLLDPAASASAEPESADPEPFGSEPPELASADPEPSGSELPELTSTEPVQSPEASPSASAQGTAVPAVIASALPSVTEGGLPLLPLMTPVTDQQSPAPMATDGSGILESHVPVHTQAPAAANEDGTPELGEVPIVAPGTIYVDAEGIDDDTGRRKCIVSGDDICLFVLPPLRKTMRTFVYLWWNSNEGSEAEVSGYDPDILSVEIKKTHEVASKGLKYCQLFITLKKAESTSVIVQTGSLSRKLNCRSADAFAMLEGIKDGTDMDKCYISFRDAGDCDGYIVESYKGETGKLMPAELSSDTFIVERTSKVRENEGFDVPAPYNELRWYIIWPAFHVNEEWITAFQNRSSLTMINNYFEKEEDFTGQFSRVPEYEDTTQGYALRYFLAPVYYMHLKQKKKMVQLSWDKLKHAQSYELFVSEKENCGYKSAGVYMGTRAAFRCKADRVYHFYVAAKVGDKNIKSRSDSIFISGKKVGTYQKKIKTDYWSILGNYEEHGHFHTLFLNGRRGKIVTDKVYDEKTGRLKTRKKLHYPEELMGGVLKGEDGYLYVVTGNTNYKEKKNKVTVVVRRYTSAWKKVATYKLRAWMYVPFKSSRNVASTGQRCDITVKDDILYLKTCYLKFADYKGAHHQANREFQINLKTKESGATGYGPYVSHSFAQYCAFKDDSLYQVDMGDGLPRGVLISADDDYGTEDERDDLALLTRFKGKSGDNNVNASIAGMEVGRENVLVAGTSAPHFRKIKGITGWHKLENIYLSIYNRKTQKYRTKWLTQMDPNSIRENASCVRLLKVTDDRFIILYNHGKRHGRDYKYNLRYVLLNGKGKVIKQKEYRHIAMDARSFPVIVRSKICWISPGKYIQIPVIP